MSHLTEVMSYPFNVDSSQRATGSTNESPVFNTSQVITLQAKKGVFQLYFTSIQIPFVFYQFSNLVNTNLSYVPLTVELYNGTIVKSGLSLPIPQANYSAYSIVTALNTALSTLWTAQYGTGSGTPVFTSTYNPVTGYITYSFTNVGFTSSTITINFTGQGTGYYYAAGYFGISTTTPTTIVMGANGTSTTSTQPCILNPINYLLVRSTLKQRRAKEFITAPDQSSTILVKIPITTQQQSWINYFQTTDPIFLLDNTISSFNFSLTTNISSNVISLQNINWSFSFIIREVIRPDYESILTTTANNLLTPLNQVNEEEVNRLKEEREQLMGKLDLYRRKLEKTGQKGTPVESEGEETKDKTKDKTKELVDESMANFQKLRQWYADGESAPLPSVLHKNRVKKMITHTSDVLPDTERKIRSNL